MTLKLSQRDFYFFGLRHLPKSGQEKFSGIEQLTMAQFEKLPNPIEHLLFEGVVDSKTIYQDFLNGQYYDMPTILDSGHDVIFERTPVRIEKGKTYPFQLKCTTANTIGIVHEGKVINTFDSTDGTFNFELNFGRSGYYSICVREVVDETTTTMKFVLKYNVK